MLSDAPVERFSLLATGASGARGAARAAACRAAPAEHLFWLGRYAERSENCARLLRAVLAGCRTPTRFPAGAVIRRCSARVARQGLLAGRRRRPDTAATRSAIARSAR